MKVVVGKIVHGQEGDPDESWMEEGCEGVENTADDNIIELMYPATDFIIEVIKVPKYFLQEASHLLWLFY